MITSLLPGRARLRNAKLRDPAQLQTLSDALQAMPEVTAVTANPNVGSLLVCYDDQALGAPEMQRRLESLLNLRATAEAANNGDYRSEAGTARCPLGHDNAQTPARPNLSRQRRGAISFGQGMKLGMVGTLGASMTWAALGKKGPHKETGALFLAFLGGHLWVHRSRLLK